MFGRMENELNGTMPEDTPPEPINFPEARDFYSNVSKATAKPGFLRAAIENPKRPAFRYNAGNVREAMNSDLTDAAQSIGRGDDYAAAMKEARQAAKMKSAAKKLGIAAAGATVPYLIGHGAYSTGTALMK
jgi:hypothetical protein